MLGSTADKSSCVRLRYEVFVVPVVVHDMCRMVQTMQNCLEVPQVQFLRVCGRRCVHAATSSRQSRDGVQIRSSTRSRRTEMGFFASFLRHFSPSVQLDVRARVAGTPGVLTPRCSATRIHCRQVRTTTTTTTKAFRFTSVAFPCDFFLSKPLSGAMESHGERAGAAARRRGRRL